MSRVVHVAAVEHMSGMDLFAGSTEESLVAQVAAYCRSHWDTCGEPGNTDVLGDNQKCVDHYFHDHENDSLTTSVCAVDGPEMEFPPLTVSEGIRRGLMIKDLVDSFVAAMRKAGGGIPWARAKDMTLGDLCETLAANSIHFAHVPDADKLIRYQKAAKLAEDAQPYIPTK